MIKKFWVWLVQSAADPNEVALTVKGLAVGAIPIILALEPFLHIRVGSDQLQNAAELIRQIIVVGLGVVAGAMTLYGFLRKLYYTFFATPPVV